MATNQPLYQEHLHPGEPHNVNELARLERGAKALNERVALAMTRLFQSMPMFWLIVAWISLWIVVNVSVLTFDPPPFPLLLTLMNIPQLPMMIAIMVGQGVLSRKQELQATEQFETTLKMYHDMGELVGHLHAQDSELVTQTQILRAMLALLSPQEQTHG